MLVVFQLELLKLKQREVYLGMFYASKKCSPRIVLCQTQLFNRSGCRAPFIQQTDRSGVKFHPVMLTYNPCAKINYSFWSWYFRFANNYDVTIPILSFTWSVSKHAEFFPTFLVKQLFQCLFLLHYIFLNYLQLINIFPTFILPQVLPSCY